MVNQLVVRFLILSLMGLSILGCAKRPATTPEALAPAPLAPAPRVAAPAPAPAPPAPRAAATVSPPPVPAPTPPPPPAAVARPAPREFAPIDALKDIHFDFDKYDVRPGDARVVEQNAGWMKANPNYLVLIEGHADERGTNEYNLALGERRARSTTNSLATLGIPSTRVTSVSYGEERPTCTERNEACWSKNRRAHFLVKPR